MTAKKISLAEKIYLKLLTMIINGDFKADENLKESDLAERFRVSRTPVREALHRLAADNLLILIPRYGCKIKKFDRSEIFEIFQCRAILEVNAMQLLDLKLFAEFTQFLLTEFKQNPDDKNSALAIDEKFHRTLSELCPNQVLGAFIRNLIERTAPFRRLHNQNSDLISERTLLYQAIINQNLPLASTLLHQHICNGLTEQAEAAV